MPTNSDNTVPAFAPGWGFFLDVDGTLLDLAPRPEDVHVSVRVGDVLSALTDAAAGAVALVSGRGLADLDRLFAPLCLPLAGLHGVERRAADATLHSHHDPALEARFRACCDTLAAYAAGVSGVQFEDKGLAASLHYRRAPQRRAEVEAQMRRAAAALAPHYDLQTGKMVYELKPGGRDKGTAIEEFMREAPFVGRTPVFIGDDVTDEDGFRVVKGLGGHAIKVGDGASAAPWRLPDAAAVLSYLQGYADYVRAEAVGETA